MASGVGMTPTSLPMAKSRIATRTVLLAAYKDRTIAQMKAEVGFGTEIDRVFQCSTQAGRPTVSGMRRDFRKFGADHDGQWQTADAIFMRVPGRFSDHGRARRTASLRRADRSPER